MASNLDSALLRLTRAMDTLENTLAARGVQDGHKHADLRARTERAESVAAEAADRVDGILQRLENAVATG